MCETQHANATTALCGCAASAERAQEFLHAPVAEYSVSRRAFLRAALVTGSALATLPLLEEEAHADLFKPSAEEQKKLGAKAAQDVMKKYKEVNDDQARSFRRVGDKLLGALTDKERGPWDYRFRVLESKEVNAFALPGGEMFIFTGLLDRIGSADELAAVTAHEVAHVREEHWARQYSNDLKRTLGLEVLLGATRAKGAIRDIAGVANGLFSLQYSRKDEDQADDRGLKNMAAAKYDLEGMIDLFKTLQAATGGKEGSSDFLRSHPLTADRIRKTQERISKLREERR